jgi:rare lipoprotein A
MRLVYDVVFCASLIGLLAGCSSLTLSSPDKRAAKSQTKAGSGGYYKDDGPGANPPADIAAIPDATPIREPLHRYANRPYNALGKRYTPLDAQHDYRSSGLGSWYGRRFHGKPTASGEPYDMYAMTAAHPILPIPSYARVSNPKNGKSVIVRINDRGPFHEGREIDLSYSAAWKLGLLAGVSRVDVEKLTPESYIPPAAETAGPALASGIYLQLAALNTAGAADQLILRARNSSLRFPGLHRIESGALIKVQAGPYSEVLAAENAALDIERELGLTPFRVNR